MRIFAGTGVQTCALPLPPPHELDALGDDLDHRALAAVLALPLARLQPALDEDRAALVEVLAAALGLLAPHHHRQEARVLALLPALRGGGAGDRQAQVGHGGAPRRA